MKKKRLENNLEVQKRLEENPEIEKRDFKCLLRKAVMATSKQSASITQ